MNALVPIDSNVLETVTGGGRGSSSSSSIDSLLGTLNSLKGTIADIKTKTNGLGEGEMLVLCMLAMQRQNNVVLVKRRSCW